MPPMPVNWPALLGRIAPHRTIAGAFGAAARWAVVGTTPQLAGELGAFDGDIRSIMAANRAARAHADAVRAGIDDAAWVRTLTAIVPMAQVGGDPWDAYCAIVADHAPGADPAGVPVPVRLLWHALHEIDTTMACLPNDWPGVHTYGTPHVQDLTVATVHWDDTWGTRWGHTLDLMTGWDDLGMSRTEAATWSSRGYHPQDAAVLTGLGHDPDSTLLDEWEALPDRPSMDLWGAACPNLTRPADVLRRAGCPAPWRAAFRLAH
jgi:hypothetical protein